MHPRWQMRHSLLPNPEHFTPHLFHMESGYFTWTLPGVSSEVKGSSLAGDPNQNLPGVHLDSTRNIWHNPGNIPGMLPGLNMECLECPVKFIYWCGQQLFANPNAWLPTCGGSLLSPTYSSWIPGEWGSVELLESMEQWMSHVSAVCIIYLNIFAPFY